MLKDNTIFAYLKKHILLEKKSLFLLLGISLISSSIVVISPLLMQRLIDEAFIPRDIHKLYIWASCILSLGIFGIAFNSYNQFKYTAVSTKILFNLRKEIFENIFSQQKIFFLKFKTGDLLSRLQGDISQIQRFATDSLFALISAALGMIGALFIMFSFNPYLATFSLFLLPLEYIILKPMYPMMANKILSLRESSANLGSFMIESLKYAIFFKTTNSINLRVEKMHNLQNENRFIILNLQKLQILFAQIPILVALTARAVLVFYGGILVVKEQMQIGEFIAFLTYFGMILAPIQTFLGILNNIPRAKVSLERLSILIPTINPNTKYEFIEKYPDIKFEDLSFKYNPKTQIFKNINLELTYGGKFVIQGDNGAGKTTLFELLLKLLSPDDGSIKISNINIEKIHPVNLYEEIGLVEQNPIILATSIKENLRISAQNASESELLDVIEKVGLSPWLEKQELSLKSVLNEDGQSLSTGQRQRISIARILLKKPSIILLDEYTSSLDEEFSLEIENLIDKLFYNKTRIIISHKKEHKNANIYTIDNKKILLKKAQNEY